jgi:hypothetical protein
LAATVPAEEVVLILAVRNHLEALYKEEWVLIYITSEPFARADYSRANHARTTSEAPNV